MLQVNCEGFLKVLRGSKKPVNPEHNHTTPGIKRV